MVGQSLLGGPLRWKVHFLVSKSHPGERLKTAGSLKLKNSIFLMWGLRIMDRAGLQELEILWAGGFEKNHAPKSIHGIINKTETGPKSLCHRLANRDQSVFRNSSPTDQTSDPKDFFLFQYL